MVQKKRAAGSAAKRKSARNQPVEDAPVDFQDAAAPGEPETQVQCENVELSPRKKVKTAKDSIASEDDIVRSYMHHAKPSIEDAVDDSGVTEPLKPKPQLEIDTKSADLVDTKMENESPTDAVSQQLEDVDIETPKKARRRVQPTPVTATRSTRSTRSKATESTDVDMTDELASITVEPRRSGRARKANPIYDEDKYLDAAAKQKAVLLPSPKSSRKDPASTKKGGKSSVWSAEHLLTSKRSKIITTEANMIFNESTWGLFTEEEKRELLGLLHPIDTEVTIPDQDPSLPPPRIATPDLFQNLNNDAFRTAYSELQEDLETGTYEPAFIKKAEEALQLRIGPMADKVDAIKDKEFEEYWGQKQAVFFGDAGLAAGVTLYELCQHKMIKKGDIFEYKRAFQGTVVIEKVCEVVDIELAPDAPGIKKKKEACTLTVKYPAGTRKFLKGNSEEEEAKGEGEEEEEEEEENNDNDITVKVFTLAQLEVIILDGDGRVKASDPGKYAKGYPNANAWKQFAIRRNDEFLGSVFMVRQQYYEKSAAKSQR